MRRNKVGSKTKASILLIVSVTIGIFILSSFAHITAPPKTSEATIIQIIPPEPATPKVYYSIKDQNIKPKVSAEAYMIGDLDTGETILAKNETKPFPIASVSKLMTALVSLNTETPDTQVQISKQALATEGENGNFHLNEKIQLTQILYPLLLESSNDAAEAIAMSAGRDVFIKSMNDTAKNIGLVATSFLDPSGLSPSNISTTADLFKFAKYLKENKPEVFDITKNKTYKNETHHWFSNNQFLKDTGYDGGKSGYTDLAMQTVISTFSIPMSSVSTDPAILPTPRTIGITLLHSKDRHKDVENILKYLKSNVAYGATTANVVVVVPPPPTPVPPPVPKVVEPDFVTMIFGGDIMLDRGVRSSVVKNFGGDYSKLFDNLNILNQADVVFANLEGTASDKGADKHSLYSFHMDPSVVPALAGAGVNILSVANNHVGDWGRDAYTDTLARLRENEILYTGGGENIEEAETPTVMEKYGIKIGFLGFTDKGPEWMKATDALAGPLMANNPRFDQIIQNASKQVDYLIVSFHFGEEYQTTHNSRQEFLAHKAIDDGAKIIIGAHPHVIEDTEVYKNGYIAYSLGNFIFDQAFSANTTQGMLLELKLNRDGSLSATKDIVHLNNVFQPASVTLGKEEKVKFQTISQ